MRKASIEGPVEIGEGTKIEHGAEITGPVVIGDGCVIRRNSKISVNSVIGSDVMIGAEARVTGSLIYEKTQIGESSYLNHCVVAEQCKVGPHVEIDEMSIVSAGCGIGDSAKLRKGARIWPNMRIAQNSVVEAFVKH